MLDACVGLSCNVEYFFIFGARFLTPSSGDLLLLKLTATPTTLTKALRPTERPNPSWTRRPVAPLLRPHPLLRLLAPLATRSATCLVLALGGTINSTLLSN